MRHLLCSSLIKHATEFANALKGHKYERTDTGIYFPGAKVEAAGMYMHDVNGQDVQFDKNLLVDQGLLHMLNVVLGGTAKIPTWYLGLFGNAVTPVSTWTAANFTASSGELVSMTEGYTESVRQTFAAGTAAANALDNYAAKAAFTVATAGTVAVNGAGLLSSNVRGGTAGTLISATRFSSTRQLSDTDVFNCGYRVTLSST